MKKIFTLLLLSSYLFAIIGINDIPTYMYYDKKAWSDKSLLKLRDNRLFNEVPHHLYALASNEGAKLVWENKLYIGTGYIGYSSNTLSGLFSPKRALLVYNIGYDVDCKNIQNYNLNNTPPTCKCEINVLNTTNVNCLNYDYNTCTCTCDSTTNDYVNINGIYQCLPKCQDDKIRDTNGECIPNNLSNHLKTPDYCKSYTGSYVIPYDHSFHEIKEIIGSDLSLHYTNIYTKGFIFNDLNASKGLLANGWDINVHHRLSSNILYKGYGEYLKDINITQTNGLITIKDKNLAYIFDDTFKHIKTINQFSNTILYEFYYYNNRLSSITNADGKTININYISNKLSSISTDTGQSIDISTDENNTIKSITYPNNQTYTYIYNENALMKRKYDPKGNRYKYNYQSNGYISATIRPEKGFMTYATYSDGSGNILGFWENGKPVGTIYRNFSPKNGIKRSRVRYPNDTTKEVLINVNGKKRQTNFCNKTTTEEYNSIHPLTNEPLLTSLLYQMPSGLANKTIFQTSFQNNIETKRKIVSNSITTTKTDYINHTKTITSPLGYTKKINYDDKMLYALSIKPPFSYAYNYEYDTRGNLLHVKRGNRQTNYTYDSYDNLISKYTDENDTISYAYDNSNRLISITYPDNSKIDYEYDLNSNISKIFTPVSLSSEFAYNGINKRTSFKSPSGYETIYSYNREGRLTKLTKPSLKSITYTYYQGKLINIYDNEYNTTINYTCNNNPSTISSTSGEAVNYTYDGDLLKKQEYKGVLNQAISYEYNEKFLPKSITYASEKEIIAYDKDNRISSINDTSISYKQNNQILTNRLFTSSLYLSNYDEIQTILNTYNHKKVYSYTITKRNKKGQILNASETLNHKTINYSYMYNNKGQLINSIQKQKDKIIIIPFDGLVIPIVKKYPSHEETYTYDEAGNKISTTIKENKNIKTINSTFINNSIQTYNDTAYIYDNDGYLKTKITPNDTINYTYGIHGELKKVQSNHKTIEYLHNINHQRVAKKIDNEIVEKYLWKDLTTLLAIYDKNDNLITRYFYANNHTPYKIIHNNKLYYPSYNHQGSLRTLIDINGKIVKEITYNPYGKILNDTNQSLHVHKTFANGLYDKDTNLIRFGKRDYDPIAGTWMAKDPIDFSGGDSNLYRYVLGDPVNLVDLEGKFAVTLPVLVVSGLMATGATYAISSMHDSLQDIMVENGWFAENKSSIYNTPDTHSDDFENVKNRSGCRNIKDGSYWEKDRSSHGGRQWKRWNKRQNTYKDKPQSIWPDGRIRK